MATRKKKVTKTTKKVGRKGKKRNLTSSEVYVRIRPAAFDGSGHDQNGEAVQKSLDGWTSNTITLNTAYMFSDGHAEYTFPKKVLGPEVSQQDVYTSALEGLVEKFTAPTAYNVFFLAYGQTGTGKTHTVFGPDASLQSDTPHDDWGLFPRLCHTLLQRMSSHPGMVFTLTASAVEFYLCAVFDLLAERAPVVLEKDNTPAGLATVRLTCMADMRAFLATVNAQRVAASTDMNEAREGHGGSSRSHCSLILTLSRLDLATGQFTESQFSMVDLAGAERPDKTGGARVSMMEAFVEVYRSGSVSVGSQGVIINFELFETGKDVLMATEQNKKGGPPFKPLVALTTPTCRYLSGFMGGAALMGMVVCVSQAPQNGWETWFSMQYGHNLAELRAPVTPVKPRNARKALVKARKEAKAAAAAIAQPPAPKSPAAQFYPAKVEKARRAALQVSTLEELLAATPTTALSAAAAVSAAGANAAGTAPAATVAPAPTAAVPAAAGAAAAAAAATVVSTSAIASVSGSGLISVTASAGADSETKSEAAPAAATPTPTGVAEAGPVTVFHPSSEMMLPGAIPDSTSAE